MTGFGMSRFMAGTDEWLVEVKSVNHKFCEVKVRLPREMSSLEAALVKTVKDRVARGAVDVWIRRFLQQAPTAVPTVDVGLAKSYLDSLQALAQSLGLSDKVSLRDIVSQPGVLRIDEKPLDVAGLEEAAQRALGEALGSMLKMREVEGALLKADLEARLQKISTLSNEVESLGPRSVSEYQDRLWARVKELSAQQPVEPQRLAQEVALMADRCDITEELTRLRSHLTHFQKLMASGEPAGRKLEFLTQELNREINTTGAKSQHVDISSRIVDLKAEVERIREQVQNVE